MKNKHISRHIGLRGILLFALVFVSVQQFAAQEVLMHSHNDYRQRVPFYQAYAQMFASIEADIYTTDKEGELLVAHDRQELPTASTIDELYLEPLVRLFGRNGGKAWKGSDKTLILLVDLKTPADPTLDYLIGKLKKHPEVFDPKVNPYAVRVVISGNRPAPEKFREYPSLVSFDGDKVDYTPEQLERVSMISLNLRNYTRWNGKGAIRSEDSDRMYEVIDKAHALGKPIRFWGTPDGAVPWSVFHTMGVDYINTDAPEACAAFFQKL